MYGTGIKEVKLFCRSDKKALGLDNLKTIFFTNLD